MATTHYVKSSGVSLAYQIHGEGEPTLLCVSGALGNLALDEAIPLFARFLERLTRFTRVVRFDKRGTALSDRSSSPLTVADQVPDVDADGLRRFLGLDGELHDVLPGCRQGPAARTHPPDAVGRRDARRQ